MNLGSIAKWSSGFNWYKWGAILILFAGWTVAVHVNATHNCEQSYLEQKVEQAETRTVILVKAIQARVPEVQARDREAAELRIKIKSLEGKLHEAINAKPDNPDCDLSDAELLYFRELAEAR